MRQDVFVISIINLVQKIFLDRHNRDIKLMPYDTIALGNDIGLMTFVEEAKDVKDIVTATGVKGYLEQNIRSDQNRQHRDEFSREAI